MNAPETTEANWLEDADEAASVATPISTPTSSSIDVHRETTRSTLAKWLMVLLTFVVLALLTFAALQMGGAFSATTISIPELATDTLTPVVTLAGTALGFYFGAHTAASSDKSAGGGGMPAPREPGYVRKAFRKLW